MTNSVPTPPRLAKAKAAAVTAAAVAATAALTFGVTSPAVQSHALEDTRVTVSDVELSALEIPDIGNIVGLYGVGPIFWVADALGLTPIDLLTTLAEAVGGEEAAQLVEILDNLTPVEMGAPGPLPGDVYDSVNGLTYSGDLILGLVPESLQGLAVNLVTLGLGTTALNTLFGTDLDFDATVGDALEAIVDVTPILNQRRAIILSEGLGGLTTSLAYRDMIEAVTSNSSDWGEGVTGQWLIFINNPSRPGGGLLALATPFTNLFGLNLSTPEGGSYTNAASNDGDITKILNTSVLDITAAYNIWSDAPTTLNPLAWANAAAGGFLITYLVPDDLDFVNNTNLLSHVVPQAGLGALNGLGVMLDITGGQGTSVIPIVGDLIDFLSDIGFPVQQLETIKGTSTFITYDSGNLPILEPLDLLPRLLGLAGVNVPQPFHNSIEDALRMAINAGYQDVDPETLMRDFDMAGDQALLWHSALTPSQQFDAGWTISNALLDGIQENLLNPVAWTPSIVGQAGFNDAAEALIQNAIAMAVSQFINEALDAGQDLAGEGFTALRDALKPMLDIADQLNAQAEGAIDDALQVDTLDPAPAPSSAPLTTSDSADARLMSLTEDVEKKDIKDESIETKVDAVAVVDEEAPANKPTLADLQPDTDLLKDVDLAKDAKAVAASLKEQRQQARAELRDAGKEIRSSIKEARSELRDQVKETRDNVRGELKKAGDQVKKTVDRVTGKKDSSSQAQSQSQDNDDNDKSEKKSASKKDAA